MRKEVKIFWLLILIIFTGLIIIEQFKPKVIIKEVPIYKEKIIERIAYKDYPQYGMATTANTVTFMHFIHEQDIEE